MKFVSKILLIIIVIFSVVLPNNNKEILIGSLFLLSILILNEFGVKILREKVFLYYYFSVPITLLYLLVGVVNGAPIVAFWQVLATYVITPFLWIIVLSYVVKIYNEKAIVSVLLWCLLFGMISYAYYLYAFLMYGPESVMFLVEEPNVNLSDGSIASTMYVFGSFIFLIGGLFSATSVVDKKYHLILFAALVTAVTTGRSALVLALLIGLSLNFIGGSLNPLKRLFFGAIFSVALFAVVTSFQAIFDISIIDNFNQMADKISSGGGEGRIQQFDAFLQGISDNFALGSGHGIPAYYTVDDRYPWRYEMVYFATIYRVGVIGALVYALPFVYVLLSVGKKMMAGKLNKYEKYLFGGFICAFVAGNTNPYIEALPFQWMYVLPLVYFTSSNRISISGNPRYAAMQHAIFLKN